MKIGVPKEIKDHEDRVGLVPNSIAEVIAHGHSAVVETGAGHGAGFTDADYEAVGAQIVPGPEEVFDAGDIIVKVKEPQAVERKRLREGQVLYTYLHLAPDPEQAKDLLESGATCIAYETVTGATGGLPLLMPMSEVAGRMAPQEGAHALQNALGGRGMLLGGVPGVAPAHVVILGGGVAGTNAAYVALGMGAEVTVIDRSVDALRRIVATFGRQVKTLYSTNQAVADACAEADLVIGTVLIPGANAPKLITRDVLSTMRAGSAIVDVAIDQGGCADTSRATTHSEPTYIVDDVVHYCVANMPGGVARTSTFALNNATLPHLIALADKGWRKAMLDDPHLRNGLNVHAGKITHPAVAEALDQAVYDIEPTLAA